MNSLFFDVCLFKKGYLSDFPLSQILIQVIYFLKLLMGFNFFPIKKNFVIIFFLPEKCPICEVSFRNYDFS